MRDRLSAALIWTSSNLDVGPEIASWKSYTTLKPELEISLLREAVYTLKSSGPRIDHWGISLLIMWVVDSVEFNKLWSAYKIWLQQLQCIVGEYLTV